MRYTTGMLYWRYATAAVAVSLEKVVFDSKTEYEFVQSACW